MRLSFHPRFLLLCATLSVIKGGLAIPARVPELHTEVHTTTITAVKRSPDFAQRDPSSFSREFTLTTKYPIEPFTTTVTEGITYTLYPPDGTTKSFPLITAWAAVGDSYAAGVDAGDGLGAGDCWRYSKAYPQQMQEDPRMGANPNRRFYFVACSGSKMADVGVQLALIEEGGLDMITLTIGGNDVGFAKVLSACLYTFDTTGVIYGNDCPSELEAARTYIDNDFETAFIKTLLVILRTRPSAFRVFVTGYIGFFNQDTTEPCDSASFSWWGDAEPKADQQLRRTMNQMVASLNNKMQAAIHLVNDKRLKFIELNGRFDGHRFCEPGFIEPPPKADDQDETHHWFFDAGNAVRNMPDLKSCRNDPNTSLTAWESLFACQIAEAETLGYGGRTPRTGVSTESSDTFGPQLARGFHPKPVGYSAIADEILKNL